MWPCLETGSPSTAAAPAVNPVHPAATPSCATNRKHRWVRYTNRVLSSTHTHALRPNTRFKTLFIYESRLIRGEHLDGRFTHQLRHLMWFKRDRGRWGCEYVWRLWMCEWAVCECASRSSDTRENAWVSHFSHFISLHTVICITMYVKTCRSCSPAWPEMFQRASRASTEARQTIYTKSHMIRVTHLISHIETLQNIQIPSFLHDDASFYSFQIPKTLFPISNVDY